MFDLPPLRANKSSKMGSTTVLDIPGSETKWIHVIQLASINSCEADWHEFAGIAGRSGESAVFMVDPSVLDDLDLLLEGGASWT